jgi:glycosyltransferase involved in cell wall biosynthesis
VGKILLHTTNAKDQEGDWQFQEAAEPRLYVTGRHFYVKGESMPEQAFLSQQLLPVHQVMPALPEPSDLPTVIMVMPFLAVGGAEKIALKIMECLADRIRFIVLTFDPLDAGLGTTADQFRQITPYVYMLPDYLNSQLNGSLMVYLIERFDPQTIYIHNGSPWIFDALPYFKRVYPSIRIVNQVYDYQIGWINRYDLALIMYLDAHIGSNPKICQAYLEKGAAPDQVFFIENGTDPVELNPADYDEARKLAIREQLGLPANTRIVTFASRLNPQKRPLDFIELARRFASDPQVTFLMVGDGPLAQPVKDQVTRSSLKNIVLQPFYQPISDILAITDVLVLPSEFEGMPMIIIETQTMGKPVVATAVGNIREIVDRTGGGVIVPQVGDISALMAGVRQMLEQPPEPEELRRTTLRHFDWRVCADKHIPAFFGRDHA